VARVEVVPTTERPVVSVWGLTSFDPSHPRKRKTGYDGSGGLRSARPTWPRVLLRQSMTEEKKIVVQRAYAVSTIVRPM